MLAPAFRRWLPTLAALLIVGLGLFYALPRLIDRVEQGPDPETVAAASLQAVRAQNRLVPFSARFVAVVTSTQRRFGLSAAKTLILPGTVNYELDLARLRPEDMRWEPQTKTLSVTLPPIVPTAAQVDLAQAREYGTGGVLMRLTDAEAQIDRANRAAAQSQLVAQAKAALPLGLARDAARRAVEQSFALPLRAAGVEATVRARFADDPGGDPERMDRSRSPAEVYNAR